MMTFYKRYIQTLRTACIFVFSAMCVLTSMQTSAQDTIPKSNRVIKQLKQSLGQVITDAGQAAALLQTSKELHYLTGQVVALCQLAGINDGQQAAESAKNLQEAQQLAAGRKDFIGASWAIREVAKLQRFYSSKPPELKKGLSGVLSARGQAMGNSKFDVHVDFPEKPITGVSGLDSNYVSAMKQAKVSLQAMKKRLAKNPHMTDLNFSDQWLDSLIDKGTSSQKAAKRLMAQKASRDSIKALSTTFAKKGNYAEAYKSYLAYTSYKDSLTAEESSRRLAQLQYNQQLQI